MRLKINIFCKVTPLRFAEKDIMFIFATAKERHNDP